MRYVVDRCDKKMEKCVVYCIASICPDANANVNANMNVDAASGFLHGLRRGKCYRITRTFAVLSQIWRKKKMPYATLRVRLLCLRLRYLCSCVTLLNLISTEAVSYVAPVFAVAFALPLQYYCSNFFYQSM